MVGVWVVSQHPAEGSSDPAEAAFVAWSRSFVLFSAACSAVEAARSAEGSVGPLAWNLEAGGLRAWALDDPEADPLSDVWSLVWSEVV